MSRHDSHAELVILFLENACADPILAIGPVDNAGREQRLVSDRGVFDRAAR
jgi:hypothetical protein